MNKILIIGGPTATGKTSLALELAKKFNGDLISADSRQVYKGLDLATGKDIPEGFVWETDHYFNGVTNIYGLDLVEPNEDWSVGLFQEYAFGLIKYLWSKKRLPIFVGGTGLYLKSLLEPISAATPPDHLFRDKLAGVPVALLQERLTKTIPEVYEAMNHSDQNNPRRLIRALEKDFYARFPSNKASLVPTLATESLSIVLEAPMDVIEKRIDARVTARLKMDLKKELEYLQSFKLKPTAPAATGLGYSELADFYAGKINEKKLAELWSTGERQYAKRQLTWFKAQPEFVWFDITDRKYPQQVVEAVQTWYS